MRLANELEHELDLGNLYCNKSETEQKRHQRYMKCYGPKLVSMAERLGALPLATEIATASKNVASTRLPVVPCIRTKHRGAYVVTPTSYRQRLWVTLWTKARDSFQICLGAPQRARHKVSRVQYLFRTAFHRTGKA